MTVRLSDFGGKARRKVSSRSRRRQEYNNKMDLRDIGWPDVDWIAQDRDHWRAFMNTIMNLPVP
jgi:hypothetical protein